jgi:hypothetical protein
MNQESIDACRVLTPHVCVPPLKPPLQARTKSGVTPLMVAAGNGQLRVCQRLLAKKADLTKVINARDSLGVTALQAARDAGHHRCVDRARRSGLVGVCRPFSPPLTAAGGPGPEAIRRGKAHRSPLVTRDLTAFLICPL